MRIDAAGKVRLILVMSTVVEIKSAIEKLSPVERAELEALLWPEWDRSVGENPPNIHARLAEAAEGKFSAGDRSNIGKILSSLK